MVESEEISPNVYDTYGSEIMGGVTVQCEVCGQPDAQRQATVIRYLPNQMGQFLGLQPKQEILLGSHSGCKSK